MGKIRKFGIYAVVGWLWIYSFSNLAHLIAWIRYGEKDPLFLGLYSALTFAVIVGGIFLLRFAKPKIKASAATTSDTSH